MSEIESYDGINTVRELFRVFGMIISHVMHMWRDTNPTASPLCALG